MERNQQRSEALCFNNFFPLGHYYHYLSLEELQLHNFNLRRHRLDALFLIEVYFDFKLRPSVSELVGLRVPARFIRDFALFNV
jgi:hypothetical protein